MKLRSIYIKAYGKLRDYSYEFCDGLNSLNEPNGYGKSTVLSFVKAMFYGLEKTRANKKEYTETAHFKPDSKDFGGTMTLEYRGDEYRVERSFPGGETLVYKNNSPVKIDDLGTYFFGVNKDSFERTLFISSLDSIDCTSEIKFKVGEYDEKGGENYLSTVGTLDEKIKGYKRKGNGGELDVLLRQADELSLSVERERAFSADLANYQNRLFELTKELETLSREENEARERKVLEEKNKVYLKYKEDAAVLKETLTASLSGFPNGLPTIKEVEEVEKAIYDAEKFEYNAKYYSSCTDLSRYEKYFENGVPSDETIDKTEDAVIERLDLEKRKATISVNPSLRTKFKGREPTSEGLADLKRNVERYEEVEKELMTPKPVKKETSVAPFVVLALAILFFIGGAVGVFFNKLVGIIAFTVGAIALALALVLFFAGKKETAVVVDPLIVENDRLGGEIKAFLTIYGYVSNNLNADYQLFLRDLSAYKEDLNKEREGLKAEAERRARIEELRKFVYPFFSEYGYVEHTLNNLAKIRAAANAYREALAKKREDIATAEKYVAAARKKREEERAFRDKYAQDGDLKEIEKRVYEIERLKESLTTAERKAEKYKEDNGLGGEIAEVNVDEIVASIEEKREEAATVEKAIKEREYSIKKMQTAEVQLERKKEEIEKAEYEYKILCKCKEFILRSEQNLRDRYVLPIKDKFRKYADELCFEEAKKVEFTDELVPVIVENVERDVRSASKGEGILYALCYRLALIDNVYGEVPFLVLDDPFVTLDEDNFAVVASSVESLSQRTQIIYATCHSSRRIGALSK